MSKYEEAVKAAMVVLCDEGADSEGGWHSWRCFDRERYPEPCDCTEQVARAALTAALAILNPTMPIERVRALHRPVEIEPSDTICGECSYRMPNGHYLQQVDYPCPTIAALDGDECHDNTDTHLEEQ